LTGAPPPTPYSHQATSSDPDFYGFRIDTGNSLRITAITGGKLPEIAIRRGETGSDPRFAEHIQPPYPRTQDRQPALTPDLSGFRVQMDDSLRITAVDLGKIAGIRDRHRPIGVRPLTAGW